MKQIKDRFNRWLNADDITSGQDMGFGILVAMFRRVLVIAAIMMAIIGGLRGLWLLW